MTFNARWTLLLAACGGAVFASLLRRKRYRKKQTQKAELDEWENEGGHLASSPEVSDTLVTAGSA